jgi:hypothetical protein
MVTKELKNAFMSHTSADKLFAEKLAKDLIRVGVKVWFDAWEIRVGDSIVEKIDTALSTIDALIIVLSPRALQSEWVRRELNSSLMRSLSTRNIKVLPVLYENCLIPSIIADLKYADFSTDYAKGFAELAVAFNLINSPDWRYFDHPQKDTVDYHDWIRILVAPEPGEDAPYLHRQIAAAYELRHFPRYYDLTLRILRGLRESWSKNRSNKPLIEEIDLTISYIEKQNET